MACLLLVGPSGGGKTCICKQAASIDMRVEHIVVDKVLQARIPGPELFERTCALIEQLRAKSGDRIIIADIGAGSLEDSRAVAYFRREAKIMMSLLLASRLAYKRACGRSGSAWLGKPIDIYEAIEYSPARRQIYSAASAKIDASGTLDESVHNLIAAADVLIRKIQA